MIWGRLLIVCLFLLKKRTQSPRAMFPTRTSPYRTQDDPSLACEPLVGPLPLPFTALLSTFSHENSSNFCWLVVSTPLKNISQLGLFFPIYGKIKHVPNHSPASHLLVTESLIFKDPMGPRLRPTQGRSPGADDECHAVPKLLAWRWRKAPGNTQGLHQPNQK